MQWSLKTPSHLNRFATLPREIFGTLLTNSRHWSGFRAILYDPFPKFQFRCSTAAVRLLHAVPFTFCIKTAERVTM